MKKHFRLSSYSCNWHRPLKVCKGIVVARALGYEVVVALCPVPEFTCRRFSTQDIKAYQLLFFKSLKENAEKVMGSISMQEMRRATYRKKVVSDWSFWDICTDDRMWVLGKLDIALAMTERPAGFEAEIFCRRFGQKETTPVSLSEVVADMTDVRLMSVHAAVSMDLSYGGMHCMFSRQGVQQLIGSRWRLFPVLSFSEATNFQTNLGRSWHRHQGRLACSFAISRGDHLRMRTCPTTGGRVYGHIPCVAALYQVVAPYLDKE